VGATWLLTSRGAGVNQRAVNRRRFERFVLPVMYTPIRVKTPMSGPAMEGHAYDVSEGGVQFELDHAVKPGTSATVAIVLPADPAAPLNESERTVIAVGNVVWLDDSEPGPVRMALAFTKFASQADRDRLMRQIFGGRLRRAA
jgi:hypothetical protein